VRSTCSCPTMSMCAAADALSAKTPGVGTRIYSFGVGAESDRPDGCEAVREAIEQGATTWREVSAMTGISHEWARQLGARIGVKPAKPVESDRPQSAKAVQAGPHRRKRKPQWNAPEIVDRFWSQVEQNGPYATGFDQPTRCWMWQGRTDAQNYGVLSVGRFRMSAHRYAYRLHLGRTPWSVVDHLCHSYSRDCRGGPLCPHRLCVNPEHLEVVTPGENARRAPGNRVYSAAPPKVFSRCRYGHPWSLDEALYDAAGRRVCVWCITGVEPPLDGDC